MLGRRGDRKMKKDMMKKDMIIELCPYCEQEVNLQNKFEMQVCPNCKDKVIPCSVCPYEYSRCSDCPLEREEE